jgi:hypothetical protein
VIKTRQKTRSGRPRSRRLIKKYLKVTFLVDVTDQTILAVSIRRGPDNDNKDFVRSFRQIEKYGSSCIGMVLADKGYDSEANHEYVHDVIGAESIIPARMNRYDDFKTRGKYRKMMRAGYDKSVYHRRNISETVNSVLKRRMGDCVRAKNVLNQNREIIFMVMMYNTEKSLFLYILVTGFLESRRCYKSYANHLYLYSLHCSM